MALIECSEAQLAEIELLSSMFPSQDEFEITDQLALAELRESVDKPTNTPPPSRPQFVIKQKMDTASKEVMLTISCTYPSEYPHVLPEIAVRCPDLSRAQQTALHADLNTHLLAGCRGDACVLSVAEWVRDNAHLYVFPSAPATAAASPRTAETAFTRLWIYSHHIYNKTKRKHILEWSRELALSGFSMPGKPGIVCVEGPRAACEEFWARLKVLTWKKIMIRHREDVPLGGPGADEGTGDGVDEGTGDGVDSLRKFTGFQEAMFDPHGNRGNHMDLGQLYQFLNDRGCGDVFQLYFGVEGR